LHQVGTSSLLMYMMHGHTYIKELSSCNDNNLLTYKISSTCYNLLPNFRSVRLRLL